jgi:hypothetical protein
MPDPLHPFEITGEKGKWYNIQKTGTDPDTGEPWATTRIPKTDAAKEVVDAWKGKLKALVQRWEEENRGQSKGMWSALSLSIGTLKLAINKRHSSVAHRQSECATFPARSFRLHRTPALSLPHRKESEVNSISPSVSVSPHFARS